MSAPSQRLELRQGQSLVMTPQLQQSLQMLQLTNLELSAFIEEELQKNPLLLEEVSSDDKNTSPQDEIESPIANDENKDSYDNSLEEQLPSQDDSITDTNYEDNWQDTESIPPLKNSDNSENNIIDFSSNFGTSHSGHLGDKSFLEQIISEEITLREHIINQVRLDISDPAKKIIASHLVDMIDENGYIISEFLSLSKLLECNVKEINSVLKALQNFSPAGIFARSLSECLKLQLIDKNRYDPTMEKLLNNINLIARGELRKLQKICGVDDDDFGDMCREIRSLNPKPGNSFVAETSYHVQADIFLKKKAGGEWAIELNNDTLPKVLVNNKYYAELKNKTNGDEDKSYIMEQYNSANWLVKCINQRAETILKVSLEIIKQQKEFFEKGIYYLKPMILATIAKELDIHESTVGRVISGKYISTSRGLYELKFFFSSSVGNISGGGETSSKAVKQLISDLIKNETIENILSDDKIAVILKEQEGIDIARRTVAKYREAMKISSSVQRRKQKKLAG